MAKKLRAEIELKNAKAVRDVKQVSRELKNVETKGTKAGAETTKGFNMAGGAAKSFTKLLGAAGVAGGLTGACTIRRSPVPRASCFPGSVRA